MESPSGPQNQAFRLEAFQMSHCCEPVRTNLLQGGLYLGADCPVCMETRESLHHLSLGCRYSRQVWGMSGLQIPVLDEERWEFSKWWHELLAKWHAYADLDQRVARVMCTYCGFYLRIEMESHRNRMLLAIKKN